MRYVIARTRQEPGLQAKTDVAAVAGVECAQGLSLKRPTELEGLGDRFGHIAARAWILRIQDLCEIANTAQWMTEVEGALHGYAHTLTGLFPSTPREQDQGARCWELIRHTRALIQGERIPELREHLRVVSAAIEEQWLRSL